jgi:hypothetical protein
VLMLLQEERDIDCMYSNRTFEFFIFEILIDNIFVMFGGRIFQQTVGIPMGTKCAPLHTGASQVKRKEASPIL